MHAGNLLTWNLWKRGLGVFKTASTFFFGIGIFLGIIAVSMWQQWSLTFGQDPQFLLAVAIVVSLAFWLGQRWQLSRTTAADVWSLASLIFCLSTWSIMHPFWIDALTTCMAFLPLWSLENETMKPLVAFTLAGLGWIIPGMLWSAVLAEAGRLNNGTASSKRRLFASIFSGVASGLLLSSLVLSPWLGVFVPAVATSILTSAVGWRFYRHAVKERTHTPVSQTVKSIGLSTAILVRMGMACLVGGLLACNLRLVNQLIPHSTFVIYVQFAGTMLGIAAGLMLASFRRTVVDRPSWAGLFAAAVSSLLLALQPLLVDLSLWMNSSLTTVAFLLVTRSLLMMAAACPFGMALAWIADSIEDDAEPNLVGWGMPFASGVGVAIYLLGGSIDLIPLMAICGGPVVIAAGFLQIRSSGWKVSWRRAMATGCLVAVAFSLPIWRSCDDASRTAKLLFSTPTYIAFRSGWDIAQLPQLDDVRMIDRHEGRTGPLTLWRGRVAELYLREAGIPRAVVTKNSDALPQFPAEVLHAVYPLVVSERPDRILFLGLSAGVPLSTCLSFPIQEAVCIEGDDRLIEMVRGPLSRETGFDPLNDDRVTLRRVSPELALMAKPKEPFDVILSSPTSSSMTDGSASFTQEFYQRASRHLAERGIFCQRFECIDYGPEPLQLVLKAIRTAFRRVIAIETSAGELLLLAANSEDVFVPTNLAKRLETPHVRRVLARSGLDWSTLLNFPAYDHEALGEICHESGNAANSTLHGQLAAWAPMELMRWGNKQQEVQTVLTSTRVSPAPFWYGANGQPNLLEGETHLSRRSRLIEWSRETQSSQELLRRLGEVSSQQKLVRENPDAHWWAYRKTLRKQLQERPRTAVQQVKAIDEKKSLHPEDVYRREYFVALGKAAGQKRPTREQIAAVEEFLEPYDPLISYFGRQETADLLARCGEDAVRELAYRLHVIYFAPPIDSSVRNVAKAIETLVRHPDTIPNESMRFDALNGLVQSMRVRWEIRQTVTETSTKKILDDVDLCLIAVEKGLASMNSLAMSAGIGEREWQIRKNVIERMLLRPLRAYRTELQLRQVRGEARTRAIIEEAGKLDNDDEEPPAE